MIFPKVENWEKAKKIKGVKWQNCRIVDLTLARPNYLECRGDWKLVGKFQFQMERRDNPQVWLLRFLLLILSRKQKSQKGRGPACLRSCHGEEVIITRESFFIKSSSSFPILKKFGTRNEGYWLRSLRCNFMHDKMKLFELWETKAVLISSAYNRVCLREWTHLFSLKIKLTKILFTNNFLTLLKVWTSWSIL